MATFNTLTEKQQAIFNFINDTTPQSEQAALYNAFDPDDYIYDGVEELAEMGGFDGVELARMVYFGDLQNWADRVVLNGYGNVESWQGLEENQIADLAVWVEDQDLAYYQYELRAGRELFTVAADNLADAKEEWADEMAGLLDGDEIADRLDGAELVIECNRISGY